MMPLAHRRLGSDGARHARDEPGVPTCGAPSVSSGHARAFEETHRQVDVPAIGDLHGYALRPERCHHDDHRGTVG